MRVTIVSATPVASPEDGPLFQAVVPKIEIEGDNPEECREDLQTKQLAALNRVVELEVVHWERGEAVTPGGEVVRLGSENAAFFKEEL